MTRYTALLAFIIFINTSVLAQDSPELTNEDRQYINETTREYNICVQQSAAQQLDNFPDVRQIAAQAINLCEHQLAELRKKLGDKANSEFYTGLERHIKNSTIKKLLPLLMFEKSARQTGDKTD